MTRYFRFVVGSTAAYEAMRLGADAALGFVAPNTSIEPYATAPVDSAGRALLAVSTNSVIYPAILASLNAMLLADTADELTESAYWASFAPAPTGIGGSGTSATVDIGTVTTGAPGSSVSVTNSGTTSAAVFNFTIPRGDVGAQGIQGIPGTNGTNGTNGLAATVSVGTVTTGAAGSAATVVNVGTTSAAVLNFSIPKGADGAAGSAGAAATVSVGTVTTGAAGTSATVTNVGTTSAAVLNFTIPRGSQGAPGTPGVDGAPGATGATGPSGVIAVSGSVTNTGTSTSANLGLSAAAESAIALFNWSNFR